MSFLIVYSIFLAGCTAKKETDESPTQDVPGIYAEDSKYVVEGEVVNRRDHDFSIQIENEFGTSDWISLGIAPKFSTGEGRDFSEVLISTTVQLTCLDTECEQVEFVDEI